MSESPASSSIAEAFSTRSAPWNNDAEQAVLGAMLLDQDASLSAAQLLADDMFYREAHRRLFRAMVSLTERRVVIDHITLRDELIRRGELDSIGGYDYVAELADSVPTAANLEYHAKIVKEKAILRKLIETATGIITEAYDGHTTASELLDAAESRIFQVSQQRTEEGFARLKEMLWPTMERIETLQKSGKAITGVPSGFADLDNLTSGFQGGELVILAARPSMGKTAFVLNIATMLQQKNHLAAALDGVAKSIEERAKLLSSIETRFSNPVERAQALLKLAGAGALTQGDVQTKARKMLMAALASPGFFPAYVARQQQDKKDPPHSDLVLQDLTVELRVFGITYEEALRVLAIQNVVLI